MATRKSAAIENGKIHAMRVKVMITIYENWQITQNKKSTLSAFFSAIQRKGEQQENSIKKITKSK